MSRLTEPIKGDCKSVTSFLTKFATTSRNDERTPTRSRDDDDANVSLGFVFGDGADTPAEVPAASAPRCKNCKTLAQFVMRQDRSGDEGMTSYWQCSNCNVEWR